MNNKDTKNTEKAPINTKSIMSMDELKEEFFKSLAVCEGCDHKLGCPVYPRAAVIGAFLDSENDEEEEDPLLKSVYDDEEDEAEETCEDSEDEAGEYELPDVPPHLRPVRELDDLDYAVDQLVDSLFEVTDKIASARQFIDRLDSRVTWMLDMLEQLGIPQLLGD